MKSKILGLDLGVGSIGWALVYENQENPSENQIIQIGSRVNPLTTEEKGLFESGKPITTNRERTLKRSARRNKARYKQRREHLREYLLKYGIISKDTIIAENGANTTHELLALRAKAVTDKIDLADFGRVLFHINKKRGYKSSRKEVTAELGVEIDSIKIAELLQQRKITPAQYVEELIEKKVKSIPTFYKSDLEREFDTLWIAQQKYRPAVFIESLCTSLKGKKSTETKTVLVEALERQGEDCSIRQKFTSKDKYKLRAKGLIEALSPEEIIVSFQHLNSDIQKADGYLGQISDRSKILYANQETIGQYLYRRIRQNPHFSTKNVIFYRQDYINEFNAIWNTQAQYYPDILSSDARKEIGDYIIFYQRRLKSQKKLLGVCELERQDIPVKDENGQIIIHPITKLAKTQTIGRPVIPISCPLFQEFRIWQTLQNLQLKSNKDYRQVIQLTQEEKERLHDALTFTDRLTEKQILKLLNQDDKTMKTNFSNGIIGNRTITKLLKAIGLIAEIEGFEINWSKLSALETKNYLHQILQRLNVTTNLLSFDYSLHGKEYENQPLFRLWHLLYSVEDDRKITEEDRVLYGNSNIALKKKLVREFGFKIEHAKILSQVKFESDYGRLSTKAIKRILPYLTKDLNYAEACREAGYNHSSQSITKEENERRVLAKQLEVLPKNSLRNPVVEKILNQMVNLVNQLIDKYGAIDEIRVEMARELKNNATRRAALADAVKDNTKKNDEIRKILLRDFNIQNPSKNDIIRYKLWDELKSIGYKDLYSGKEIRKQDIFTGACDIDHIIPQSMCFDDSLNNKVLTFRDVNLKKSDRTAYDFVSGEYQMSLSEYLSRINLLKVSTKKKKNLLKKATDVSDGFIERDLRDTQYITRQAINMLKSICRTVTPTTGLITDKLRQDWGLINVMKELNFEKYHKLNQTKKVEKIDRKTGEIKTHYIINDWTKRDDHRHHAMDALTVAFTSRRHIQYLNRLNAIHDAVKTQDVTNREIKALLTLRNQITAVSEDDNGDKSRRFISPIVNFRNEVKKQLSQTLVSIKNKNKVTTKNTNIIRGRNKKEVKQIVLTPRGQLHKETIYGKILWPQDKPVQIKKTLTLDNVQLIINPEIKGIVLHHLAKYDNNPEVAFISKTLKKDPILYKNQPVTQVQCYEVCYTVKKPISEDLKIEQVVDGKIQEILYNRLQAYDNDKKRAFSDLDTNPIWFNKDKGIAIKRVVIKVRATELDPLRSKEDNLGNVVLTPEGNTVGKDYIQMGNNHHVAIYKDKDGQLQESIIPFYEAVQRACSGYPIINKTLNKEIGWEFLFSMKINEMFVFPNDEFDVDNIDYFDKENYPLISKYLYRVQKLSSKDYYFRHHLETSVNRDISGVTMYRITSINKLNKVKKVRLNHIGDIVEVGEY